MATGGTKKRRKKQTKKKKPNSSIAFRSLVLCLLVLAGIAVLALHNGMLLLPSENSNNNDIASTNKKSNIRGHGSKNEVVLVQENLETQDDEEEEYEEDEDSEDGEDSELEKSDVKGDGSKVEETVTVTEIKKETKREDNNEDPTEPLTIKQQEVAVERPPPPNKEDPQPASDHEKDASENERNVVATLNDDGTYAEPPEGGQVVRILVLTYNRASSLARLLKSLQNADYRKDTAHLDIWIDRKNNHEPDTKTLQISKEACTAWSKKHGDCNVHVRTHNVGLRVQWLTTWDESIPGGLQLDTTEKAVILEDDLEVSKHYWRWLRYCHAAYGTRSDFSGCTLQRAALCAKRCSNLKGGPANADHNFMYPLVGSWGYSPNAAHWSRFTTWAKTFQAARKKPYVEGLTPTDWYKSFEKQGRCPGIKCMWTMLHIKYVDTHEDKMTVYTKALNGKTMACNYQEAGLHYSGTAQGADAPLVNAWDSASMGEFKQHPTQLGWDGWIQKSKAVQLQESKITDSEIESRTKCVSGQLKP